MEHHLFHSHLLDHQNQAASKVTNPLHLLPPTLLESFYLGAKIHQESLDLKAPERCCQKPRNNQHYTPLVIGSSILKHVPPSVPI